ncbi:glycerophosphodiester phosphodiesterase [Aneurinibacillus tyrosinisolvens]|uniref:glycerophosphodiester phosphodiesterase n=1 Tax=Aneurinibacillus tyrosinisolvens TaxID=1443435 RepID=UPI00063ED44C|nr:glycerophosphodiester phosphodiesterase family protein [Aneurinibacillus tyrosinisolvens]
MDDIFTIYAHRGSSAFYPENTLLSFSKAVQQGANGIELDVQLTKDNHVVVFHDVSLHRITGKKGQIGDYTLKELRRMDVGRWKNQRFAGIKIPTLEQVFNKVMQKDILLNIELKNFFAMKNGLENRVIELIKQYELGEKIVISTFNPLSLQILQESHCPSPVALLYFGHLRSPWEYAKEYNCTYVHPPLQEVDEKMLSLCRANDLKVIPYHVNTQKDIAKMIRLGTDGIITSQPKTAHNLLFSTRTGRKKS